MEVRIKRRSTKVIHVGGAAIGGRHPVSIQSMTKTDTRDVRGTVNQIKKLARAGCEIVRVAVPDSESCRVLPQIKRSIQIPLIADIHFDWKLAVRSIENGVDGIRINPGNIGGKKEIRAIITAAAKRKTAVRIGVNSGSLDKKWIRRYKGITAAGLVNSALEYVRFIEDLGFGQIKISIKSPDIRLTIAACREISKKTSYPLHIGLTEAGPVTNSAVRSSIVLGTLLMEGIGDTIRVSVTGSPETEVLIAREILQTLGLRSFGPQIISCPTCSRCQVDLIKIVDDFKKKTAGSVPGGINGRQKVAIMGCVVNGPGEARDADIGIACGLKNGVLFKKGKPIGKVAETKIVDTLIREMGG